MNTRPSSFRFAVVASVTVLAACPARDADPILDTEAIPEQPHRDPAAVPEAAQTVPLEPLHGAVIAGEAQVMPVGTETQLVVNVTGAAPGTTLLAHVLTGRCDLAGPIVADLQPITPAGDGRGSSRTVIGVAPSVVLNGNHFLLVIERAQNVERPVACAEIPHHPQPTPQPVGTAPGTG